jgi:copper homeostasis protein
MRKIEVCCGSLYEVREAEAGGAVRVELCGAIACGGVTPSYGLLRQVAEANVAIDVNVLIRPREGSFFYNTEEIDAMCQDIALCRELGFHGVVIGALTADGDVDIDACRRMMEAAGDMSVTFHRAFDVCRDPRKALEDIVALGCDRLLSSGQECSAEKGAELLSELVEQAAGRIIVMPGAGIRPSNIALIEQKTGAAEFHSTARVTKSDGMNFTHPRVSFAVSASDEGRISLSDRAIVSQLVNNRL